MEHEDKIIEMERRGHWIDGWESGTPLERLDDARLAELKEVAREPCPDPVAGDEYHLSQCLRTLLAVLPRRNADDLSGELFVAAYHKMLSGKTRDEINYLAEEAMRQCRWFPTIAECLDILGEFRRRDKAFQEWRNRTSEANRLIAKEQSARTRDDRYFRGNYEPLKQEDVDKLSPQLIEIGLKCEALRRDDEGKIRPWFLKPGEEIKY